MKESLSFMQTPKTRNEAADAILGDTYKVLDHGFVRLVDYMGGDADIEQAARVSYDAGASSRKVSETRGLIRYLLRHRHTTPCEMVELKFHCKMPIFVARQWIRHRTANVNEMSGRYSVLPEEFYIPEPKDVKFQSKTNKQGRAEALPEDLAKAVLVELRKDAEASFQVYQTLLGEKVEHTSLRSSPTNLSVEDIATLKEGGGLAKELARINLPLSAYTEWYWKIDLHNLMHFLNLRLHPHAQHEIRVFADVMYEMAKKVAPMAIDAFDDYVLHAVTLSRPEQIAMVKVDMSKPETERNEKLKAILGSDREVNEFLAKLDKMKASALSDIFTP